MATLQTFSRLGYRIRWRLYFPDGTNSEKHKASRSRSLLRDLMPDIMALETLSARGELTAKELFWAINLKLITREEAERFAPTVGPVEEHTLGDLRLDLETLSRTQASSPHCHRANLSKADILEAWFTMPITGITPETIERFRDERKRSGLTNTTINHDVKILRKCLDIAVNKGWLKDNPARRVKLLSEPKDRIPRCFYPQELKIFFGALDRFSHLLHGDFSFIVKLLIYTGLRRSEICNLKPENVKLHLRQLHIQGKGKKTRIVGIRKDMREEFRERVERGHILPEGINESSISHAFKKMIRALALPEELTLHSLRHTYISYLLERGIPSKQVKERAGHSSLVTTERYTHALPFQRVVEDEIDFEGMDKKKEKLPL